MIRFFRNLRLRVLSANKFSKYLLYAIGEVVLVVIGILIAVQINNWNENRKIGDIRTTIYQNLLEDLRSDSNYIDEKIEELNIGISAYDGYLDSYKAATLSMHDVLNNQNKLDFITTTLRFHNSTVTSLENTGEIKLIPSYLRKKITAFKRDQDYLIETNTQWNNNYFDRIENAGIYGSQPHLQNRIKDHPLLAERLGVKDNLEKIIWSIEIAMLYKRMNEQNMVSGLKKLKQELLDITESINTEITKN